MFFCKTKKLYFIKIHDLGATTSTMVGSSHRKAKPAPRMETQTNLHTYLMPPGPIMHPETTSNMEPRSTLPHGRTATEMMDARPLPQTSLAQPLDSPGPTLPQPASTSVPATHILYDGRLVDFGDVLRTLPTKEDIRNMTVKMEEAHRMGIPGTEERVF